MPEVYLIGLSGSPERNVMSKFEDGLIALSGENIVRKEALVAVKVHFGEWGNLSFIRHQFARKIIDVVRKKGGKPFLTDTNTLYVGSRSCAPDHIITAIKNGFGIESTGAPIIIADGLRGDSKISVPIKGDFVKRAIMGAEIVNADSLFVITHFKGHELTGFGGVIKNLGMGCAAREGKLFQHSTVSPTVEPSGCVACSRCIAVCPADAISLVGNKAYISQDLCIGCADCIVICPESTINISWNEATDAVMGKMAEYALGAVQGKGGRCLFANFLTQISPLCDCYGFNDIPVAPDMGILLSTDPVAIDQASVDLVMSGADGRDVFKEIHPHIDWEVQLRQAEKIGLGSRTYRLEHID